jgi:hypothetical protein
MWCCSAHTETRMIHRLCIINVVIIITATATATATATTTTLDIVKQDTMHYLFTIRNKLNSSK